MQVALSAAQAAQFLNVSERQFHKLRLNPAFPSARFIGTRKRWVAEELVAYIKALPAAQKQAEPEQLRQSRKRHFEPKPEAWPVPNFVNQTHFPIQSAHTTNEARDD